MSNDQITQQAQAIMDQFMEALEQSDLTVQHQPDHTNRLRTPQKVIDESFPQQMFKNAPAIKDDCIVAEKKGW